MAENKYTSYLSPFSWRYGSNQMRHIWSETNKRLIWRKLWVSLAKVQSEFGLVTIEQLEDLQTHAEDIDIERALEIESIIHHDLMAEVKTFAEQCDLGSKIIHLGMTSMDIVDNADALRIREALDVILVKLKRLLNILARLVDQWAESPIIGFTHLQPAEPTTLGYRFAQYTQDLLMDWDLISHLRKNFKGKGFKGATGTSASYAELMGSENLSQFDSRISELLNLPFFPITTQVYPRKQDYSILSALSGLGASLYKFAFDLRILQSPPIGELAEPFGTDQVGSSAMPFKRNPIQAEKINSLARMLAQFPRIAWDNAAHTLLERTLDDSANRRTSIPEAFLITDEILSVSIQILKNLHINEAAMKRNLAIYGQFASTERVLMSLVKAGANRQDMHERLRKHSLAAWEATQNGKTNPLADLVSTDPEFLVYLSEDDLRTLMDATDHIGDAPKRAKELAQTVLISLDSHPNSK
ncbi:MAG: adenylosuccinate lyase [Anaerolineales bacterium]|nr:adenylosuccinate lyase [Anaerolineales bacterium]